MFYLNVSFFWNFPAEVRNLDGVVYLASGNSLEKMQRKQLMDHSGLLFDPQLYLAGLGVEENETICGRLASYPWFAVPEVPEFSSGDETRTQWEQAVKAHALANWPGNASTEPSEIAECAQCAVEFQANLPCSEIILASPLIVEREEEAESQAIWLDKGLEAAHELDVQQALLATVAVADVVLNEGAFEDAGFLDTIVDQVTAREGLSGVYIVVAQSQPNHPLLAPEIVARAYAHLCQRFGEQEYETVLTNFADVLGLACHSAGATDFATGPSQSLRRLCIAPPSRGRGAIPKFYSHRNVAEYFTESDLTRVRDARKLGQVQDNTSISRPLFQTLRAGGTAADLPLWAESRGNVKESQRHFIQRLINADRAISNLNQIEVQSAIQAWLEGAARDRLVVESNVSGDLRGACAEAEMWAEFVA